MSETLVVLIIGIPLTIGVSIAIAGIARIQSQLDAVQIRQQHAMRRANQIKGEAGALSNDVQKLPSKLRATKEYLISQARKTAAKPVKSISVGRR